MITRSESWPSSLNSALPLNTGEEKKKREGDINAELLRPSCVASTRREIGEASSVEPCLPVFRNFVPATCTRGGGGRKGGHDSSSVQIYVGGLGEGVTRSLAPCRNWTMRTSPDWRKEGGKRRGKEKKSSSYPSLQGSGRMGKVVLRFTALPPRERGEEEVCQSRSRFGGRGIKKREEKNCDELVACGILWIVGEMERGAAPLLKTGKKI